jgi:hypothetical protein
MVAFTIAKNRINSASSGNTNVNIDGAASYGKAIWLTLAGFICFLLSGCGFTVGRRIARARQRDRMASEALKPRLDDDYASDARESARYAAERRTASTKEEADLPYFAEPETVPLRAYGDKSDEFGQNYGNGHTQQPTTSTTGYDRAAIDGVGTGYGRKTPGTDFGRRSPHQYQDSLGGGNTYPPMSEAAQTNSSFRHSRVGGSQPVSCAFVSSESCSSFSRRSLRRCMTLARLLLNYLHRFKLQDQTRYKLDLSHMRLESRPFP